MVITSADVVSTTITNSTASIMAAPRSPMRWHNLARYLRLSPAHNPFFMFNLPLSLTLAR